MNTNDGSGLKLLDFQKINPGGKQVTSARRNQNGPDYRSDEQPREDGKNKENMT